MSGLVASGGGGGGGRTCEAPMVSLLSVLDQNVTGLRNPLGHIHIERKLKRKRTCSFIVYSLNVFLVV